MTRIPSSPSTPKQMQSTPPQSGTNSNSLLSAHTPSNAPASPALSHASTVDDTSLSSTTTPQKQHSKHHKKKLSTQRAKKYILRELNSLYEHASMILMSKKSYKKFRGGKSLILKDHHWELTHFLKKLEQYEELTPFRFSEETKKCLDRLTKALPKDRKEFSEDPLKKLFSEFLNSFEQPKTSEENKEQDDVSAAAKVTTPVKGQSPQHVSTPNVVTTSSPSNISQSSPSTPPPSKTSTYVSPSLLQRDASSTPSKSSTSAPEIPEVQLIEDENLKNVIEISDDDTISLSDDEDNLTSTAAVNMNVASINKSLLQNHSWESCQMIQVNQSLKKLLQLDSTFASLWKNYYNFVKNIHARDYSFRLVSMNMLKLTPRKVSNILDSQDGQLLINLMSHFDVIALQELEGCSGDTHDGLGMFYEKLGSKFEYYIQTIGTMREGFLVNTTNVEVLDCIEWNKGRMEHTPLELVVRSKRDSSTHRIVNVHLKPSKKTSELITVLETMKPNVVKLNTAKENSESLYIVGDINYTFGGSSSNMDQEIKKTGWVWMNDVTEATTPTGEVYDALLMHKDSAYLMKQKKSVSGVYKYPALGLYDNLQKSPFFSDHYPVYLLLE